MIDAVNLTKKFGDVTAVDNLTFHVAEGETFGFPGPSGAGKTTTVRNSLDISGTGNADASQCAPAPQRGLGWHKGGDHITIKRGFLQRKKSESTIYQSYTFFRGPTLSTSITRSVSFRSRMTR